MVKELEITKKRFGKSLVVSNSSDVASSSATVF